MSTYNDRIPVKSREAAQEERAERQSVRALRARFQEVVDSTQTDIDALAGAPIAVLRATAQSQRRMIGDLARAMRQLARIVGGPDR
jgi:hypothetical protein